MSTRGRQSFVCFVDLETLVDPHPSCPQAEQHRPSPEGYVAASEWAESMLETHEQQQCPGCGLWLVWTPRPDDVDTAGGAMPAR